VLAEVLEGTAQRYHAQTPFVDLGMDSMLAAKFSKTLSSRLGIPLSPTLAFDFPSISALSLHLLGRLAVTEQGNWLDTCSDGYAGGNGFSASDGCDDSDLIKGLTLRSGRRVFPSPRSR
jgi:acyl carrier protein